ncbi:hypothetical protein ALO_10854 [Acetonema longum DSM 6540]|uniref:Uncharacterized protein n=1 Tax=Acetonema longum DSM 6540 TaxID=1009370 RepID=F7NJB5_9FIRM|nr:hypothetical protein ALO_10854 [Acetonema longum DSM 6540]
MQAEDRCCIIRQTVLNEMAGVAPSLAETAACQKSRDG